MRFEIWQLPTANKAKFLHFDWLKEKPSIYDYVMVYSGEKENHRVEIESYLEDLYEIFNVNHPEDYHAASLSVSDLICLIDEDNRRTWWYVDGIGFKKVNGLIDGCEYG